MEPSRACTHVQKFAGVRLCSLLPAPTPATSHVSLHSQFSHKPILTNHSLWELEIRLSWTLGWDAKDTNSHTWHPVHPVGSSQTFGPPTHSPFSCGAVPVTGCHSVGTQRACLPPKQQMARKRELVHTSPRGKNECNGQTVWSERRVVDTWPLVR